jgi:electron transport complex protein RnfG
MKLSYLIDAWLVLLLAVGIGAALAGVQISLNDRILTNQRNKTLSRVPIVVPGAVQEMTRELTLNDQTVYKAIDRSDKQIGWVIRASGNGYADKIELLIGLSPDASTVTGIDVLKQSETPALGNKIVEPAFRDQFAGKATDQPVRVVKDGGDVVAVTAATVSSRAVCDIVNKAVAQWKPKLAKQD